jgi:hypothetical protein
MASKYGGGSIACFQMWWEILNKAYLQKTIVLEQKFLMVHSFSHHF